jgi:hypothetical protein
MRRRSDVDWAVDWLEGRVGLGANGDVLYKAFQEDAFAAGKTDLMLLPFDEFVKLGTAVQDELRRRRARSPLTPHGELVDIVETKISYAARSTGLDKSIDLS